MNENPVNPDAAPVGQDEAPVDHRRLGRELGLFGTDPLMGAGLPYWLPDGATVRHALEEYIRSAERRAGYRHVYSPVLGKRELYEISGHWSHYREDMFPPMALKGGEEDADGELVLRPSLCPHHALIYRSRSRSYRELPLRMAELGGMYRSEPSGVVGGLTRVRAIQLNDAHVFCTLEQAADEAAAALGLIRQVYRDLGIEAARCRLSLPDDDAIADDDAVADSGKYVAAPAMWKQAAALLTEVLERSGVAYEAVPGEAAFYGPKIDVQIVDAAGRESTLSTVQIDFHQPERFGLHYIGEDGAKHRPVMVHRSIIGSVERAVAQLIEVHRGAFPAWLAPTQVAVLPVSGGELEERAARDLVALCAERELRAELVPAGRGSLGARIRDARLVPYQAVVGGREADAGEVSVRLRDGRRLPPLPVREFADRVAGLVRGRAIRLWGDEA
ncbi:threonine--tRNA ligase [Streptomyces triticagri]|uniref:Threonine--tRNA ligase n=1 Tax=Streptomyces triticagri TaxID=2293568 RepID=A0A372M2H0_9ACTN|nr:threonine--tRNA ligase [Streptomyces triticagri]RFU84810.1 threonine--tRNA ligase [Streptomyces triticagri]